MLLELACAMLFEKNLPIFLWDKAVAHAAYLCNQAPTQALDGTTPFKAWTGEKPNVGHLHEFSCDIWVLDESKNRSKLSLRSNKMKFTGFMDQFAIIMQPPGQSKCHKTLHSMKMMT